MANTASSATPAYSPASDKTQRDKTVRVSLQETGVLAVRATRRQHALVGRFLRQIAHSARRQVLIEATIVEVELTREFETGVDWSRLTGSASPQFVQNSSNLLSDTALRGTMPLDRALGPIRCLCCITTAAR